MADRRAELERKKALVAQMRQEKLRKDDEEKKKKQEGARQNDLRQETEDILRGLGIVSPGATGSSSTADLAAMNSPRHSALGGSGGRSEEAIERLDLSSENLALGSRGASPATSPAKRVSGRSRSAASLSVVRLPPHSIPPIEPDNYSKETQTGADLIAQQRDLGSPTPVRSHFGSPKISMPVALEWDDDVLGVLAYGDDAHRFEEDFEIELHHGAPARSQSARAAVRHRPDAPPMSTGSTTSAQEAGGVGGGVAGDADKMLAEQKPVREFSEEEKLQVMHSEKFQLFIDHSSRLVERAFASDRDLFIDYKGLESKGDREKEKAEKLRFNRVFEDEKWSRNRYCTSLDWSTIYPELLLASYNANEYAVHEPEGTCLVWNLRFGTTTPEFIFTAESPVTCACFAMFQPNLVIGGTYSGQILLWDNRVNKRTPVQRTLQSSETHTQPIGSLNIVGSANAHQLISLSTDGRLCSWTLDMLAKPYEAIDLMTTLGSLQQRHSGVVTGLCMSFFAHDSNNLIVGAEDGTIYSVTRHGSKQGINELFENQHFGPVTGVSAATAGASGVVGSLDLSQLFLSSSFDCSVKLWHMREKRPLLSFEEYGSEYVSDVGWSPLKPSLFCSVDMGGRAMLWDLIEDTEMAAATLTPARALENYSGPNPVPSEVAALNKLRWHSTGLHIAVGDSRGRVFICDVNEKSALPSPDDWGKFARVLQTIRSANAEAREAEQTRAPGGGGSAALAAASLAGSGTPPSGGAASLLPQVSSPALSGGNTSVCATPP